MSKLALENLENNESLQKDVFQKNADFIYSRWQRVQIGDFETRILDVGEGEPVFVVPICNGLEAFDSLIIQQLSKEFRVITFRRRENEKVRLDRHSRAADIKKVLDYLGIKKAHFISHSSGSIATTTLALKHPELFLSYVWMNLSAVPAADLSPLKKTIASLAKYLPISDKKITEMLSSTCAGEKKNSLLYHRIYEQFTSVKQTAGVVSMKKWFINNVWLLADYDWSKGLDNLCMPVLLINSDDDLVNSVDAMSVLDKQLPNSHGLVVINRGWHLFQYPCADQVLAAIENFYEKLGVSKKRS
jgi:pimeloyl-ACP methyl ester carboxylesterase